MGICGVLVGCQFSGVSEVPGKAWSGAQESTWLISCPGDSGAKGWGLYLEEHTLRQDLCLSA